ncbi:MAG: NAD+ synthase [Chitinophagales bacterium]|nr:NAD+ synthase [Chitinophagales bacterium]
MKIAIAQLNYHIGNFEENFGKIKHAIADAKAQGADLVLFAELAVCGYPPRDFLEFRDFIEQCRQTVERIAAEANGIAVIVGAPSINPRPEGKDLFNSAYFLANGQITHIAHKALLPTYDIFDEYRYFEPATDFATVPFMDRRIALTVCEDLWNVGNDNPMYRSCPMESLSLEHPDFLVNISASPFDYGHAADRIRVLKANAHRYGKPIFYVNHVGASTEILFDGGSLVVTGEGAVYDELPYFKETVKVYDLDAIHAYQSSDKVQPKDKIALIHDALVMGIKDYFQKLKLSQAILGLSGGIDSALTLVLATRALGADNVKAVTMPSQFSSEGSVSHSQELANNLGCKMETIAIKEIYEVFISKLAPFFEGLSFNTTEENIQARVRGVLLMALSNKFGYILLNTTNKSEAAVGYGTLYGDMAGGLAVLGDVYKTEVYALCRYINRDAEIIPLSIIDKAPSAELRPNQKDADSLPEYDLLDQVLYQYIEQRKGPKELVEMGFEKALVDRILRMVNINEYKRFQTPPILRVSPKAFGMGRRMPIEGKYLS